MSLLLTSHDKQTPRHNTLFASMTYSKSQNGAANDMTGQCVFSQSAHEARGSKMQVQHVNRYKRNQEVGSSSVWQSSHCADCPPRRAKFILYRKKKVMPLTVG